MEITKIRDLGPEELRAEELKAAEQIFRIRFQLALGQKEGVKKLRELKQAIARMKTVERERALDIRGAKAAGPTAPAVKAKSKTKSSVEKESR